MTVGKRYGEVSESCIVQEFWMLLHVSCCLSLEACVRSFV